jgi:tetratricopeptide (TPR) repeat protein
VFKNTRRLSGLLLLVWPASASPELIEKAEALYQNTEHRASLQVLAGDPDINAAAYVLMGKDYFMLGEYGSAARLFEKAAGLRPRECSYELWLARAYGRRKRAGWQPMTRAFCSSERKPILSSSAILRKRAACFSSIWRLA